MSAPAPPPPQDDLYEEADDIELDDEEEEEHPKSKSTSTLDHPEGAAAAPAHQKVEATPAAASVAAAATTASSRPTSQQYQLETAATICPTGGEAPAPAAAAAPQQREPVPEGAVLLEEEGGEKKEEEEVVMDTRACVHCGEPIGHPRARGAETLTGPLHLGCVLAYKFLHQPRCTYCRVRFQDGEANSFVKDEKGDGALYHASCFALKQKGQPFVKPTKEGEVRKFAIARSRLSRKNWKRRYFVLSEANGGICYYEDTISKKDRNKEKGEKGGDKESSSGSDEDDHHQNPAATANNTTATVNLQQMILKGTVPLKDQRNRLLSRPFFSKHAVETRGEEQNAIGILFYDDAQSTQERRLIFQLKDKEDYKSWLHALEAYIYTVDDPADYENEEAIAAEEAAAKEKEKKEKKDKKKEEKDKKKEKEKKK